MKRFSLFLLCAAMLVCLYGCGGDSQNHIDETATETETEAATKAGSETLETVPETATGTVPETETENETATETQTETVPETEAETEPAPLWAPDETVSAKEIAATPILQKTYEEQKTTAEGTTTLDALGLTLSYTSTFYGHDAAINREYMKYGRKLSIRAVTAASLTEEFLTKPFLTAEVTGDTYTDLLAYENGVLTVYPATHTNRATYEYNGETHHAVIGYDISQLRCSFGKPITAELGIPGTLRGVADFDRDGRADLLLCGENGGMYIAFCTTDGWSVRRYGAFSGAPERLFVGDLDGDGLPDLVYIEVSDGAVTALPLFFDGRQFTLGESVVIPMATGLDAEARLAVGDLNQDGRADLAILSPVWDGDSISDWYALSLFGRGDGRFGPDADETGNDNLYARCELSVKSVLTVAIGDANGDGVGDLLISGTRGTKPGLSVAFNTDDAAYDYSAFGMITEDGTYRIYSGGRWYDTSDAVKDSLIGDGSYGDGDHVLVYDSADGLTWTRYIDHPTYYLGLELGQSGWETIGDGWWTGNTLEPEVIYVDGVYHMFTQSSGTTQSGHYGDYIGYASSTDGYTFIRKTDSPVILPEPGADFTQFKEIYGYEIGFNHEEVIYVPDDPDGKCFWLYTGHFKNGNFAGYVRLRSSDPTVFYWSERESTTGFSEIGNQVGYVDNYDGRGGRLFLRITFNTLTDAEGTRTVPTLYCSTDGLHFTATGIHLAGSAVSDPLTERNHNCYFLGFFSLNGTGAIPVNSDGSITLRYLATTSNAPAGMDIFAAEVGIGVVTIRFS